MLFGEELLVLKIPDKLTATQAVADAKEHPLIPHFKHIRAGNILISADPEFFLIEVGVKQLPDVVPVLKILGFHHHWGLTTTACVDSIVDAIIDPDIGIEVRHPRH